MSGARRMTSIPSIFCPTHGAQIGLTRCRWCGHDPLKLTHRVASRADGSGRTDVQVPPLSFPLDLQNDQFQNLGDRLP